MIRLLVAGIEYLLRRFGALPLVGAAVGLFLASCLLIGTGIRAVGLLGLALALPAGAIIAFAVPFALMRSVRSHWPGIGAFIDGERQFSAWWLAPIRGVLLLIPAVLLALVGVLALGGAIALAIALGRALHIHS